MIDCFSLIGMSQITYLIFREGLRLAQSPQSEEEKMSVKENGNYGDDGFLMEKGNVGGDWRAWTIGIERETLRLETVNSIQVRRVREVKYVSLRWKIMLRRLFQYVQFDGRRS